MTPTDDLLAADTSELTMLGRGVDRAAGQRPRLECFTTQIPLTSETHRTSEWVSLSPDAAPPTRHLPGGDRLRAPRRPDP